MSILYSLLPQYTDPVPSGHPDLAQRPRLRIIHPHPEYAVAGNNVLLNLIPTDGDEKGGIDYHVLHTACAIIANNRFDGIISRSANPALPPDDMIVPEHESCVRTGEYYFHVPGDASRPYAVVPNFRSWTFPHHHIPRSWQNAAAPPVPLSGPTSLLRVAARDRSCRLSCHSASWEVAHIIPLSEEQWFNQNGMAVYNTGENRTNILTSESNLMLLRNDIHDLFDRMKFCIAPKCSADQPSVLAAHATTTNHEIHALYHNRPLLPVHGIPAAYWLSRFAWHLFPELFGFLQAGEKRVLAVRHQDSGVETSQYPASECRAFCEGQGRHRSASPTKRQRQEMQDGLDTRTAESFDSGVSDLSTFGIQNRTEVENVLFEESREDYLDLSFEQDDRGEDGYGDLFGCKRRACDNEIYCNEVSGDGEPQWRGRKRHRPSRF